MRRLLRTLCVLAVVTLGIGGASSLGARSAGATQDGLKACQEDLQEARQAVQTADEMLALARKKKLVILAGFGGGTPVDPEKLTELYILYYVSGHITRAQLAKELAAMARAVKTTQAALIELRKEARKERDELAEQCGSPEKERKDEPVVVKAGAGDLRRTGLPVVGPDQTGGLPITWKVDATGATVETDAGSAKFTWALPVTITKAGAKGKLTVTAEPGKGGERSNLATSLRAAGEVTFLCGAEAKPCPYPEAGVHTLGGNSPTATMTFTIKPNQYSVGRKEPVIIQIQLAPNGRVVTYKYDIVD